MYNNDNEHCMDYVDEGGHYIMNLDRRRGELVNACISSIKYQAVRLAGISVASIDRWDLVTQVKLNKPFAYFGRQHTTIEPDMEINITHINVSYMDYDGQDKFFMYCPRLEKVFMTPEDQAMFLEDMIGYRSSWTSAKSFIKKWIDHRVIDQRTESNANFVIEEVHRFLVTSYKEKDSKRLSEMRKFCEEFINSKVEKGFFTKDTPAQLYFQDVLFAWRRKLLQGHTQNGFYGV